MNVPSAAKAPRQRHRRKFGWLLVAFIVGCGTATTVQPERPAVAADGESTSPGVVALEVDFAGEQEPIAAEIPCPSEAPVFQLLEQAAALGVLKLEAKGSGETAFVVGINGTTNQQAKGRNWVFRVNDELAHEGSGTFLAKPGDRIQWRFGTYEPAP